jgi:2-amino-4-hydroxy-6-hydroxymethyldihydropteridine diphosphokinase
MPRCFISLGGNLGNVSQTFDRALEGLEGADDASIVAVSTFHKTHPVGQSAGAFLNAAAEIETRLAPLALLDRLQAIEHQLGRVRTVHWGPRTLDLDILFYGSEIIDSPRLTVPHPAAWYRRFVLDPLVEIAPRFVHPQKQADIQALRERLLPRPIIVALAGGESNARTDLAKRLKSQFANVRFVDEFDSTSLQGDSDNAPALTIWLGNPGREDSTAIGFEELPLVSRLDATKSPESAADFVRHVLQSALG